MSLRKTLCVPAAALLGLLLAGTGPAAAKRAEQPSAQRSQLTAPRTTSTARAATPAPAASRPAAAARTAQARPAQGHRVERAAPLRGRLAVTRDSRAAYATSNSCTRDRQGRCRGTQRASMNWTQGLPPAALVQANDCPGGTMATLARGHETIVRCVPL